MDIQWSMIWTQSNAAAARAVKRRDAFADPLDRPEWEGLGWAVRLMSRTASSPRVVEMSERKKQEVQRFTAPADARSVCVS